MLLALSASEQLGNLEQLTVFGHELGPRCVEILSAARLPALTRLSIVSESLGDAGVKALANATLVGSLRSLSLNGCQVKMDGVLALGASTQLQHLEVLDLRSNGLGPSTLKVLKESARLPKLREILL